MYFIDIFVLEINGVIFIGNNSYWIYNHYTVIFIFPRGLTLNLHVCIDMFSS